MNRFTELLEKRKKLETDILEEEELIELSKSLSKEDLENIDPELLTYSSKDQLKNIMSLLDKLDTVLKQSKDYK